MDKRVRLTQRRQNAADMSIPYPGNVNQPDRTDPDWEQYHTFEQQVNHELPDMRHEWKDDTRDDIGFGVPEQNPPTVASVRMAANKAVRMAVLLLGEKVGDGAIESQARDFMAMSQEAMDRTLDRFAKTQKLYAEEDEKDDKDEDKEAKSKESAEKSDFIKEKIEEKKEEKKEASGALADKMSVKKSEDVKEEKKEEEKEAAEDKKEEKVEEKEAKSDDKEEDKAEGVEAAVAGLVAALSKKIRAEDKKDEKVEEKEAKSKESADEKEEKKEEKEAAEDKKEEKVEEKEAKSKKSEDEDDKEEDKKEARKASPTDMDIELTGSMDDVIAADPVADARLASLFADDGLTATEEEDEAEEKEAKSKKAGIKKLGGQPKVAAQATQQADISSIWQSAPDVSELFK